MANKRSKSSKEASPSWVRVVAAFAAGVLCTLVYTTQLHSQPPPLQRVNQGSNVVLASGGESSPKAEDEEVLSSVAPVTNTVVGGYRYGDKFKCDKTKLRHIVTPAEHTQGYLEPSSLLQLVETFRNCGVIALEGAIGLNDTAEFRSNLEKVCVFCIFFFLDQPRVVLDVLSVSVDAHVCAGRCIRGMMLWS